MAITITATAGSATANSFCTETEYIAFLATRLNVPAGSTVTGTTCSEDEKKAMIEATRELTLLPWAGSRTDSTQVLSLPREYLVNPDLPWAVVEASDDYYYDNDVVPERVKEAQYELAMEFTKAGTTDIAVGDSDQNIRRKKVDILETEYFGKSDQTEGLWLYPRVMELIWPLLDHDATSGSELIRA